MKQARVLFAALLIRLYLGGCGAEESMEEGSGALAEFEASSAAAPPKSATEASLPPHYEEKSSLTVPAGDVNPPTDPGREDAPPPALDYEGEPVLLVKHLRQVLSPGDWGGNAIEWSEDMQTKGLRLYVVNRQAVDAAIETYTKEHGISLSYNINLVPTRFSVAKQEELMAAIEDGIELHPGDRISTRVNYVSEHSERRGAPSVLADEPFIFVIIKAEEDSRYYQQVDELLETLDSEFIIEIHYFSEFLNGANPDT